MLYCDCFRQTFKPKNYGKIYFKKAKKNQTDL